MDALIRVSVASDPTENALRVLLLRLYAVSSLDPDARVQGCVGKLLGHVLPAVRELGYREFLGPAGPALLADIEQAALKASPNPDGYLERLVEQRGQDLHAWASRCTTCSTHPGALATATIA
jgi:hypothetical protein